MVKMMAFLIALLGWFALILQFVLMMTNADSQDIALTERIIRFFSYFTIQSNILVATAASSTAFFPDTKFGSFFVRPTTLTAIASYIAIVGLIYSLLLRSVWAPQGWQAVADHLLHDALPIMFLIYWLIAVARYPLSWSDPFKWMIFPITYILYSIVRGAIVGWYPYYFADAGQLGYPKALLNSLFVIITFLIVGMIFIAIGKLLVNTAKSPAS